MITSYDHVAVAGSMSGALGKPSLEEYSRSDLEALDEALAGKLPFSDFNYLFDRTVRRYLDRLDMLAPMLPSAAATANALTHASRGAQRKVLGDPVTRSTINQALANMSFAQGASDSNGLNNIEGVLQLARKQLSSTDAVPLLQLGCATDNSVRFFEQPLWFWTNDRQNDLPTLLFRQLYIRQEHHKSILVTPTPSEREIVVRAVLFLSSIFPKLAKSVLSHVNLICICDVPENSTTNQRLHFESFTTILIPGTIFISRHLLRNVWSLAEAILHEALHTKLYDFQHTHSLFLSKDEEMTTPILCAVWNRPAEDGDDEWTLNRSLFAFHVYVHLGVYFRKLHRDAAALEESFRPCGYSDLSLSMRRAFDRAHYLGHNIGKFSHRLGLAGQALMNWLGKLLNEVDPQPPVAGSYIHLVMDLYRRETLDMSNQGRKTPGTEIAAGKAAQVDSEIKLTQALMSRLGLPDNFFQNTEIGPNVNQYSLDTLTMKRLCIAEALSRLSQDQCNCVFQLQSGFMTVGEIIRGMVLDPLRYALIIHNNPEVN